MVKIGGFRTEDPFFFFLRSILFFAFFVLSLTLSVAVYRQTQQVLQYECAAG